LSNLLLAAKHKGSTIFGGPELNFGNDSSTLDC
jgi:hypothetical protein